MKIYTINDLANQNFDAEFLNSMRQQWHSTKSVQFFDAPKKYNLLLYIYGCTFTYTDKNGKTFVAHSGDVVYTPIGSEYSVEISEEKENAYTIGINFYLYDESHEHIIFSDTIQIFHSFSDRSVSMLFQQTLTLDVMRPLLRNKILLLEILCSLASHTAKKNIPERIINCLSYLSEHIEENPTVGSLASFCGVSEVYLRKEFRNCTGLSPLQYRNRIRLDKARSYLEYGDISVQEISDMLGYSTVSHFIKEFRVNFGMPPLKYRIHMQKKHTSSL